MMSSKIYLAQANFVANYASNFFFILFIITYTSTNYTKIKKEKIYDKKLDTIRYVLPKWLKPQRELCRLLITRVPFNRPSHSEDIFIFMYIYLNIIIIYIKQ